VFSTPEPVTARAGAENPHTSKSREIPECGIGEHDNVAAATSVAPVRAAPRDVLLAAEAEPAMASAARLHVERRLVMKHGDQPRDLP